MAIKNAPPKIELNLSNFRGALQIIGPVFIKLVLSDLSRWTSDSKGERERVAEQSGAMEPR